MGGWYRQFARLNNARIGYSLVLVLQIVPNPRHGALVAYFGFASTIA